MDLFIVLAIIGAALFLVELLLPTGGVLAAIGAAGLIAAGILALGSDSELADAAGPGLIAVGVLSFGAFVVIGRKVLRSHHDAPVRSGEEELVGLEAEARSLLNPEGQVFADGALWRARLAEVGGRVEPGAKVLVESVDGLTLVVRPLGSGGE